MSNTVTVPRGARRVTRSTMAEAVADRVPFRYNASAAGDWTTARHALDMVRNKVGATMGTDRDARVFVVWSYTTPVAVWAEGAGWWVWSSSYSVTTNRHLSMVRRGMTAAERLAAGCPFPSDTAK